MLGAVAIGLSACVTPPRAPEAASARSSGTIRLADDSARIFASDGHPQCSDRSKRCGKPVRLQVGSAEIWFTNLTSCTSDSAAERLLIRLDGMHGPIAFMLQTGDVVVMTERYLAWLDTTWSSDDPIAGGLLRGLWNITFPLGPCHGVRVPDAARDALLPGVTSRGAGHSLILNTDPACVDGGSVGGSRVPFGVRRRVGTTSSRNVASGGGGYRLHRRRTLHESGRSDKPRPQRRLRGVYGISGHLRL